MLLLTIIAISYIQTSVCVKSIPGQPVPHAEVLDELLSKYLGDSYSNNALFNFILGEPNDNRDANFTNDNLDIKILDVDNVRKMINFAKKKHGEAIAAQQARRQLYGALSPFYNHTYVNDKALDLMKQTIYLAKERINATIPYRKKYYHKASYQIAILYGAASAIFGKMQSLLAQMKKFAKRTHFLWFLIIYEKILACNIDIHDSIEKLFLIQKRYIRVRGPKAKSPKTKLDLDKIKSQPNIPQGAKEQLEKNIKGNP